MTKVQFKSNPVKIVGDLPQKGTKAPNFKLRDQALSEKSLGDYAGKKILLNIFPSLDTDVCASSVRTFYKKVTDNPNVIVVNISMDLPFAAKRFCTSEGIEGVVTLSAFDSSFPDDYGVRITEGPLKGLCTRAVILLDEEGQVIYEELVPEITHEPNYEAVLTSL